MKIFAYILVIVVVAVGGWLVFGQDKVEPIVSPVDELADTGVAATTTDNSAMATSTPVTDVKTFEISATNYKYSLTEIKVKKSDTVRIVLDVEQGFHDWVVDEFDVKTKQMQAGGTETIEFVVDEIGTFEFYCSVGSHRAMGMVGKLIVE